ncbi:hypothetical protein L208DRAFT_1268428 [Tricholoma matsutake]|nr:hypothetical protein L208DRAFT_1268428 [Tricholoma matsutake 945]
MIINLGAVSYLVIISCNKSDLSVSTVSLVPSQIVFTGPVHSTKKKTETRLNWTGKDWTKGLFMDWYFPVHALISYSHQFHINSTSICTPYHSHQKSHHCHQSQE